MTYLICPHLLSHNSCWTKSLISFTHDTKLNTFTFIYFTLYGTNTRTFDSSIILQLPSHLLTLTVNGQQRGFEDTHYIGPLELEANNISKLLPLKMLNNPKFHTILTIKYFSMFNISDLSIATLSIKK